MHLVLSSSLRKVALKILPGSRCPAWPGSDLSGRFLRLAPDHGPALQFRDRLAFLDPHGVARLERIVLVVRVVVLGTANRLLLDRMGKGTIDAHHNRLGLLDAEDHPLKLTFGHLSILTSSSRGFARLRS